MPQILRPPKAALLDLVEIMAEHHYREMVGRETLSTTQHPVAIGHTIRMPTHIEITTTTRLLPTGKHRRQWVVEDLALDLLPLLEHIAHIEHHKAHPQPTVGSREGHLVLEVTVVRATIHTRDPMIHIDHKVVIPAEDKEETHIAVAIGDVKTWNCIQFLCEMYVNAGTSWGSRASPCIRYL